MKARFILFSLCILIISALPVFAQEDCPDLFKAELENISGVDTVIRNQSGFLAILKDTSRKKAVSVVSNINKLRKNETGECDFSGVAVAIMDSELDQIKSKSSASLSKSELTKLLYDYVYKLSPVQVEENLKGYEKLSELAPQNNYYKARKKHYAKRAELVKARAQYIARCLNDSSKDKSILNLKIKRDFYLFVVAGDTPLKTAEAFMDKIAQETPRPEKKMCVIAYTADLNTRQTSCPVEYQELLNSNEEELLMRHVQSLPGFKVQQNINGYKALKKINPNSTLYTKKLSAYESKQEGLQRFLNLRTVSGEKLVSKNSNRGSTLYATISNEALAGKSTSANRKLFKLLTEFYATSGYAYKKCVLKSSAGKTLGTISCGNFRCTFRQ
ncbi:hypothetical protein [Desulfovibrio sp. JC022]|uniref:hypothetical protein n=1 Tax=Desulfovibrio sp. JC022 TaxID=2593642 RepID=UPI0013CF73AF|nr:hypothetical protein [Desulfovibrio sp. JC022]NDV23970.1 hypothetical protein [Desulfovibrio sp. JC022]